MRAQMKKQQKTAEELAEIIKARMNVAGVFVAVNPDPAYGWHPTVMSSPNLTVRHQQLAEQIATELRASYDLKLG
jgi:hypothetical protein